MYVELFGTVKQADSVPDKVHLQVRHLSGSFFRAGDNTIKKYVQSLGPRSMKFDRQTITNSQKCREKKQRGENPGKKVFKRDLALMQVTDDVNKIHGKSVQFPVHARPF